jgi:hypothetical protein
MRYFGLQASATAAFLWPASEGDLIFSIRTEKQQGLMLRISFFALLLFAMPGFGQSSALHGIVTDPTGAIVPGATVTVVNASGGKYSATSDNSGAYSISNLQMGSYTLTASAPDMTITQPVHLEMKSGTQTLNLTLQVQAVVQKLNVEAEGTPTVSTEAANNASAMVLRGSDLDALSDDPNDLADDLQALAGPAAGPNGGAIYIDGFSGGELPPKNTIREIRINQNPFAPEYDRLGFGRIEIFTKPGTDKFHGTFGYNFANDFWNSRNPYAAQKAPFHLNEFSGNLAGPLSKRASFNLDVTRENDDNGNVINGETLDPTSLMQVPFTGSVLSYSRWTRITPRIDYQLGQNHTLSARYVFNNDDVRNAGTGAFNLTSRGYHYLGRSNIVQVTETAVLSANTINETRFQYYRPDTTSIANTPGFALQVLGAFNGGGNPIGRSSDVQNSYEIQNYTSVLHHQHTWKFGVRLRAATDSNISPQNFAGTFTFGGQTGPQLDANNQPVLDASGQPVLIDISSIESYRRTLLFQQLGYSAAQIRQLGAGATQFTISAGNPLISASQVDVGAFVGDDWKVRPNLTVSLGLRYETQTNIHDIRDFAPRVGVAWGLGRGTPKTVLRAGFGMFYDRFSLANTLTAFRYNGTVQQQLVVTNPDFFPAIPSLSTLTGAVSSSTIQTISPTLRAPYLMQSALGLERQLPMKTTVAVTYANSHGLHQLRSQDINAPLPGTFDPTVQGSGVFPLGRPQPIFEMESSGLYNQNQVIVNVNTKMTRDISLNGSYMYNRAMSNTDGLGTFPANPYSMVGEYGPAATDVHYRVFLAGTVTPILGIRFNPLLVITSGPPFDITTGQDLYGDTLFNGRPGIATNPNRPGVIQTAYGLLDPNPIPGETILPRNFGRGPAQVVLNMRVGRTFSFGGERGTSQRSDTSSGPPRGAPQGPFSIGGGGGGSAPSSSGRYSLTISMNIRNLLNHNNPGPITGDVTSPLFGRANQPFSGVGGGIFTESANNRRLELQTRFTF